MAMKGITIRLSETTLKQLEQEARASDRSVAAIIRERVEHRSDAPDSVYTLSRDIAGSLSGARKSATNDRRMFATIRNRP